MNVNASIIVPVYNEINIIENFKKIFLKLLKIKNKIYFYK